MTGEEIPSGSAAGCLVSAEVDLFCDDGRAFFPVAAVGRDDDDDEDEAEGAGAGSALRLRDDFSTENGGYGDGIPACNDTV